MFVQGSEVCNVCMYASLGGRLGSGGVGVPVWLWTHTPSCTPAPRSWPRLSCCSGHSPRLSGVPQNLLCTVPRLMSCPPAYSAQPALCLRSCPQPPGSLSQPATPRSPAHQPINVLSALILPQDPHVLFQFLWNWGTPKRLRPLPP